MSQPLTHGTRACYRRGCRHLPCRAAEASYRRHLRRQHAIGAIVHGATLPAWKVRKLLLLLQREGYRPTEIAQMLRLHHSYRRLFRQPSVRVSTALKVRRFYRTRVLEDSALVTKIA